MTHPNIIQLSNLLTSHQIAKIRQINKFVFVLLVVACLQFVPFSTTQAQTETRERILIVTTDEKNGVGIATDTGLQNLGVQYNNTVVDEFQKHSGNAEIVVDKIQLNDGQSAPADFYSGYDIVILSSVFATIDEADRTAIQNAVLAKSSNVFVFFVDSCNGCSTANRDWLRDLVDANATTFADGVPGIGAHVSNFKSFPLNTASPYADSFTGLNPMYAGWYSPFTNVPVDFILYKESSSELPTGGTGNGMALLLPLGEAKGSCIFATYDGTMFHADANAYAKNEGKIAPAFLAAARGGSCFTNVKQADLSITIADPSAPVDEGGAFDYTVTIQNNGPDAAPDTQVQIELPTDFTLGSTPENCSDASNGVLTCTLGEIASGGSQPFNLSGTANNGTGGQTLTIKASVSSASDTTEDPALGNNTATEDTLVNEGAALAPAPTCNCETTTTSSSSAPTQDRLLGSEVSIYTLDNGLIEDSIPEPALKTQTGTIHGDPQPTADRFGNPNGALYFDGVDDYIETNEESNQAPLTFSVWFKADNISDEHSIVDSDVSGSYGHSLIIGYDDPSNPDDTPKDGSLDVQYHNGFWDTGVKIIPGEWYHAAVTYGNNTIKLYLGSEGEPISLHAERDYPLEGTPDGSNFRFGRHNGDDPQWFQGAMDDIRFYKEALSQEQLQEISDCTCPEPAQPDPDFVCPLNSSGDVHITTPDNLVYDFQERNDFILSHSTNSDAVMLQARQEPWPQHPDRAVAVNTAVAMNVAGDTLEFYLKPTPTFFVNGQQETSLPTSQVTLPQGGALILTQGRANDFTIFWPDNHTASRVRIYPNSHMDVCVKNLNDSLTYEGLLGNLDGVRENDVHTRDGATAETVPVSGSALKSFGDSWIPRAGESLFQTPHPTASAPVSRGVLAKRTSQNSDIDQLDTLTINDFDPAARAEAEATCADAGITDSLALYQCTYDLLATESESFIEGALSFQESTADIPDEAFAAATEFQGLPVPLPGGEVETPVTPGDGGAVTPEAPAKEPSFLDQVRTNPAGLLTNPAVLGVLGVLLVIILLRVFRRRR